MKQTVAMERNVKAACDERDGITCQACGRSCPEVFSRQHRIPKGSGGSRRAEVHGIANRVRLCGSATTPGGCHLLAEQRDPQMAVWGFALPLNRRLDPSKVPLRLWTGAWVLLKDDGTTSPTEPPTNGDPR